MSTRYLTLIRHASAVSSSEYRDYDRPLKKKGIEKIRQNAEIIGSKGYYPDLLVSSSALRALQTAELLANYLEPSISSDAILQLEQLYLPSADDMRDVVRLFESSVTDAFLVSHNNGISFFAQDLCGNRGLLMPTGSVIRIKIEAEDWSGIGPGCGEMIDFLP